MNGGSIFVQGIDQLEQVVVALFVHRQVSQLVDDDQIELGQALTAVNSGYRDHRNRLY